MKESSVYIEELRLIRSKNIYTAMLCCCYFPRKMDYEGVVPYLHTQELSYYNTLKYEKRIRSYLMGRFVAKKAVGALISEQNMTNIFIDHGIFNQPIVIANGKNIQVGISHCEDFGVALAFPETHPMGIDLEKINPHQRDALEGQVTEWEKRNIGCLPITYDMGLTLLWTAKEALSKVFKTGLMTPFDVFEICKIELCDYYIACYYKNFPQYKVISFTMNDYMCSIVHPLKTQLRFDIHSIKLKFD